VYLRTPHLPLATSFFVLPHYSRSHQDILGINRWPSFRCVSMTIWNSEFLMHDKLITVSWPPIPPPHYTELLTFILYHLGQHCCHLIFFVMYCVPWSLLLFLRLVLYILIITLLVLHKTQYGGASVSMKK